MSTIRKQSIISSVLIYVGFAFGALNTYLFTREGGFTKEQYGLTGAFLAFGTVLMSLANFGMPSYVNKFSPYYKDYLSKKKNDQPILALSISIIGYIILCLFGILFKPVVASVFDNSPQIIQYYNWLFVFTLGLTLFSVLESLAWHHHLSVFSNYLKEVQYRILVTVLFVLLSVGVIPDFDFFVKTFSFLYLFLTACLLFYLLQKNKIQFTFSISKVTKRMFRKIITLSSFIWSGSVIGAIANMADVIIIMAILPDGLAIAGLYTFAQYLGSVIQVPQRSIIAASVAHLSQAWKDKDHSKINRIYHRSSLNQLIFSVAVFCLICLNYKDAIITLNLQQEYLTTFVLFLLVGLVKIIDMGTGVSGQIISTSTFWRFDFLTGILLLFITLPLSWMLTIEYGFIGPAIANLIGYSVYNFIRYVFLLKKLKMQPFTAASLYSLLLAAVCFFVCYFLFNDKQGVMWLVMRSILFIVGFGVGVIYFKLTPDLIPVWNTIKQKYFWKK